MYKIYGITDVGKVRQNNEDGFVVNRALITEGDYEIEVLSDFIAVVADGMGGENAGEIASFLALESFATRKHIQSKEELKHFIEHDIQNKLFQHMERHPETRGMGATLAGVLCNNHKITIFHIGDSRVYRFRRPFFKRLTKDHSLVEMLYAAGQILFEEKQHHPKRNILLRSLGQKNVEVEIAELLSPPEIGDVFLLCSDGLTEYVTDEEIEMCLSSNEPLEKQGKQLVELAKNRGGADNITIVLIKRDN
ncbi:protein phosphatase 2C domain-containing protein [Parageobacillus sp. G301]|jgi:PPM family protein phosphatase|uniref:PP2C family protein-serine/threonine phosphatase n=1 Tax=Parageobacillus sp. G301 TaxID=2998290 RepID=UPI00249892D7|nr:protein phosphatase 2C domain-containing protein [Parageobacillus sp. G301]GLH65069.1 protein phosphatase [Parageobacillus sp. G301]